jgi:hypothetical protein
MANRTILDDEELQRRLEENEASAKCILAICENAQRHEKERLEREDQQDRTRAHFNDNYVCVQTYCATCAVFDMCICKPFRKD